MTTNEKTPAVYEAWRGVCEDMARGGIGKNRQASMGAGGNYRFRGIDDVLIALSASLVTHKLGVGIVFGDPVVALRDKGNGKAERHIVCCGAFTLVSQVDGSREGPFRFVGEAADSGDKASNKAMSIAYKYFAIQTFAIPTEGVLDDEEPNAPDNDRPAATKPAPQDFRDLQVTRGRDKGKTIGNASDEGLDEFQAFLGGIVNDANAKLSTEDRARAQNLIDACKREKASR